MKDLATLEKTLARQKYVAGTFAVIVAVLWIFDVSYSHCQMHFSLWLLPSSRNPILAGVIGAVLGLAPLALIVGFAWLVGPKCSSCGAFLLTRKRLEFIHASGLCPCCRKLLFTTAEKVEGASTNTTMVAANSRNWTIPFTSRTMDSKTLSYTLLGMMWGTIIGSAISTYISSDKAYRDENGVAYEILMTGKKQISAIRVFRPESGGYTDVAVDDKTLVLLKVDWLIARRRDAFEEAYSPILGGLVGLTLLVFWGWRQKNKGNTNSVS